MTTPRPSPVSSKPQRERVADRIPAVDADLWQHVYLILTAMVGLLFVWTLSATDDVSLPLRLIFLAVLVLTLNRWTAAVLLGLIQVQLLFLEPPAVGVIAHIGGFLWIMLTLLLVLVVSRYRTLQDRTHSAGFAAIRHLFGHGLNRSRTEAEHEWFNLLTALKNLLSGVLKIAVCATVAAVVLNAFPVNPVPGERLYTYREFSLIPSGYRLIRLSLTLFAVFLVSWIVINESVWRRLSPRQASVYLRSTFLNWVHRDLRMVILKRMKIRRAKARKVPSMSRQDGFDTTVAVSDLED
ncbi:MAG: hypothetical protein R3C59_19800 [Planctomycetaceae bacterium]